MSTETKRTWRKKARKLLAAAFGGKCTVCGYDKTIAALDYHHVDQGSKDKALYIAMRNGHAWSKIVEEARKCTLVCCRCHREIHAGITFLPENYARFDEGYVDAIRLSKKEQEPCLVCGKMKDKLAKFCSLQCCGQEHRRFHIEKDELEELIRNTTYSEVGRMFGVTCNAVKKRCRLLGIELVPRKKKHAGVA